MGRRATRSGGRTEGVEDVRCGAVEHGVHVGAERATDVFAGPNDPTQAMVPMVRPTGTGGGRFAEPQDGGGHGLARADALGPGRVRTALEARDPMAHRPPGEIDEVPGQGLEGGGRGRDRTGHGVAHAHDVETGPRSDGRRPVEQVVDAGVVAASRAVAASLGITVATQAAAVRAHGEGGRGCTRDFMDRPFVPKRTSRVRIVDRAFLDLLVERVADGVAVVDGKPMVRCAPPEVVVTVDPHPYGHGDLARLSVSTSLAYADMTVVHGNAVAIPFPASLASEVRRTVRDAVGPNGAFEGFAFRDGAMAPREGSVVTDPPPRPVVPEEWFDKVEEVLSFRGVPLPDRSWPEHERRAAMTERVAEPRRTTVGWHATLSAAVAWCVETGPILRPAVGPTAPDVLDALTSPGSP